MLTQAEVEAIQKVNSENEWGLSLGEFMCLLNDHKAARGNNDSHGMELVEERLTDINYHSEVGMLQEGRYNDAILQMCSYFEG